MEIEAGGKWWCNHSRSFYNCSWLCGFFSSSVRLVELLPQAKIQGCLEVLGFGIFSIILTVCLYASLVHRGAPYYSEEDRHMVCVVYCASKSQDAWV